MKISELISYLKNQEKLLGDIEVMILDGFNGGGYPREINLIREHKITLEDCDESADCEGKFLDDVVLLGYGCY